MGVPSDRRVGFTYDLCVEDPAYFTFCPRNLAALQRFELALKGMPFVVLIPGILCMVAVLRGGTRRAFLKVVLPAFAFLPSFFALVLPHFPSLTFLDTVTLSLGIGMVAMNIGRWKFSRMDFWIALFMFSDGYSERIPLGIKVGIMAVILRVLECWIPYMAGKLLLEQPGMRAETIKRIVVLTGVASLVSIPECFTKRNFQLYFWEHFFPGQWASTQIRSGFGRVGGVYGGGESAGMVLLIVLPFAFWLHRGYYKWEAVGYLNRLARHTGVIIFILAATIVMTQSRGPWIGLIIALIIASIGRAKRPGRRAVLVFGLGLLVGGPLYSAGKEYTSGQVGDVSEERGTAQYRRELIDNYVPIAESGGAWGWGNKFPMVNGQGSIDNQYLLVWLVQGYVGLAAFILIVTEGTWAFTRAGILTRSFQERHLVFTLLGIWLGLAVCLATVWLNSVVVDLFFLLAGWSQAIRPAKFGDARASEQRPKNVLLNTTAMRVYS
jgi:hypothetical protein